MHVGDIHFFGDDADKFRIRLDRDNSAVVKIGDPGEYETVIFSPPGLGRTFDYLTELRDTINEALEDPMFADQREQAREREKIAEEVA